MVIMEVYYIGAGYVQRQREAGKCMLEDIGEVKGQAKCSALRTTKQVCLDTKPFMVLSIDTAVPLLIFNRLRTATLLGYIGHYRLA